MRAFHESHAEKAGSLSPSPQCNILPRSNRPKATRAKLSRTPAACLSRCNLGRGEGWPANLLTLAPAEATETPRGRVNNLPGRNAAFCKISFVAPFDVRSLATDCFSPKLTCVARSSAFHYFVREIRVSDPPASISNFRVS